MSDLVGEATMRPLALLVAGLLVVHVVNAAPAGCPKDLPNSTAMKRYGDLCYQFVSEEKYWYDARRYCFQNGGRLVKIDNSEVNSFVLNTLNGLWWRNNGIWIGLHDTYREMHFQWTGYKLDENEPLGAWSNWGRGHPGAFLHSFRDCVRMVRENGQWRWHETPCGSLKWHYRFICEYKAVLSTQGEQLSLTQDKPMSANKLQEKSTASPKATTAGSSKSSTSVEDLRLEVTEKQTVTTESLVEIVGHFEDEWNSMETENQENLNSFTTAANDDQVQTTALHEDFFEEKNTVAFGELPAATAEAIISHENTKISDDLQGSNVRLAFSLGFCLAAASAFLFAVFLIHRRKKATLAKNENCNTEEEEEKKEKESKMARQDRSTKQSAVANVYVIGDVTDSSRFPERSSEDKQPVSDDDALRHECNTANSNEECEAARWKTEEALAAVSLYAEIPDGREATTEVEHIYESLDEFYAKITA